MLKTKESNAVIEALIELLANQVALLACRAKYVQNNGSKLLDRPNPESSKFDLVKQIIINTMLDGISFIEYRNKYIFSRRETEISFDDKNNYHINGKIGIGKVISIGRAGSSVFDRYASEIVLHKMIYRQLYQYVREPYNLWDLEYSGEVSSRVGELKDKMNMEISGNSISTCHFKNLYNIHTEGRESISDLLSIWQYISNMFEKYISINNPILSDRNHLATSYTEYKEEIISYYFTELLGRINVLLTKCGIENISLES